jgi:hypothetical protein
VKWLVCGLVLLRTEEPSEVVGVWFSAAED